MVSCSGAGVESRGHSALGSLPLGGAAPARPGTAWRRIPAQLDSVCVAAAARRCDPLVGSAMVFRDHSVYGAGVLLSVLPRLGAFARRLTAGRMCFRIGWIHRQHVMAPDGEWRSLASVGVPVSAARWSGRATVAQ